MGWNARDEGRMEGRDEIEADQGIKKKSERELSPHPSFYSALRAHFAPLCSESPTTEASPLSVGGQKIDWDRREARQAGRQTGRT